MAKFSEQANSKSQSGATGHPDMKGKPADEGRESPVPGASSQGNPRGSDSSVAPNENLDQCPIANL